MNGLLWILLAVAITIILAPIVFVATRQRTHGLAANIGEKTHDCAITRRADAVLAQRFLIVKHGSDANHAAVAGAADMPLGTVGDEPDAEGKHHIQLFGRGPTKKVVASVAIALTDEVFLAAGGKVQKRPVASGTYWYLGVPLTAAGADDDVIELNDCAPQRLVIA